MRALFAFTAILGLMFSAPAVAKSKSRAYYFFGLQDYLHKIQNVDFKDPNGEDLSFGYRTTTVNFLGGRVS